MATEEPTTLEFSEVIQQCRTASFGLGMAHRSDAGNGRIEPYRVTWEGAWTSVSEEPSEFYGEAFVSFENVARGEDSYGQADTVVRSNFRSLMRDFPDFPWVRVSYLNTDGLGCFVSDLTEDMLGTLVGLSVEYPLYDECDHSALEHDEIYESWNEWLRYELYRKFDHMRMCTGTLQAMWDVIGEDRGRELFWSAVSADMLGSFPEHHGTEVVWGPVEDISRVFRPLIIRAYVNKRRGIAPDDFHLWVGKALSGNLPTLKGN